MSRFAHEHPDDPEGAWDALVDRADHDRKAARENGDPQPRAILDPSFAIYATWRDTTRALYPGVRVPDEPPPPRDTSYPEVRIPETAMPTLADLLHEAAGVEKICRQMCADDGVDPDEGWVEAYGKEFKNWEHHVANVHAVLRAMRALAS